MTSFPFFGFAIPYCGKDTNAGRNIIATEKIEPVSNESAISFGAFLSNGDPGGIRVVFQLQM